MSSPVHFEVADHVGRITLARPESSNAIDLPTAQAFGDAVTAASSDEVRAVLVTGSGKRFCAGGDVRSFLDADAPAAHLHHLATLMEAELRRLSELPKPVVAGVHGSVAGAGLALVLNADVVIAARSTRFLTAYAAVGLTPDCGVSYLLPRAVGLPRALELALTGRVLTAEEARDWGLVSEVVDDRELQSRAQEVASGLASGPAWALGQAKRLLRAAVEDSRATNARDEAATIATTVDSADSKRLISDFLSR